MRVTPQRVHGTIVEWTGSAGWVKPAEVVDHPDYDKNKKGLRLSAADVVPKGHVLSKGMEVTFFVYADGLGLGAESCMEYKGVYEDTRPKPEKILSTATAKGKAAGRGLGLGKACGKGVIVDHAKGGIWIQTDVVSKFDKPANRPAKGAKGAGKQKGKAFVGKARTLPRKRVTEDFTSGRVLEWKGAYGWIEPDTTIDHPRAEAQLYIHKKDLAFQDELSAGQVVTFHVFEDKSGLGVEECMAC